MHFRSYNLAVTFWLKIKKKSKMSIKKYIKKKSDFFFVKKCYSSDNMSKFGSQIKKHGHWAIDDYIHSSGAIPVWTNSSNLFLLNKKSDFFFFWYFFIDIFDFFIFNQKVTAIIIAVEMQTLKKWTIEKNYNLQ